MPLKNHLENVLEAHLDVVLENDSDCELKDKLFLKSVLVGLICFCVVGFSSVFFLLWNNQSQLKEEIEQRKQTEENFIAFKAQAEQSFARLDTKSRQRISYLEYEVKALKAEVKERDKEIDYLGKRISQVSAERDRLLTEETVRVDEEIARIRKTDIEIEKSVRENLPRFDKVEAECFSELDKTAKWLEYAIVTLHNNQYNKTVGYRSLVFSYHAIVREKEAMKGRFAEAKIQEEQNLKDISVRKERLNKLLKRNERMKFRLKNRDKEVFVSWPAK